MRVLFVTPYYFPAVEFGGPPKRLHEMAKRLIGREHEVSVLTFDSNSAKRSSAAVFDRVRVRYVPWRGTKHRQFPVNLDDAREAVKQSDVAHCFGLYNLIGPALVRLCRQHAVPYVLEPMGMFVPLKRSLFSKRVYNAVVTRWMAQHAAAIVATSSREAQELSQLARRTKLVVRRNGIETAEFANLGGGSALRAQWNIPIDNKLIGFIGRISSKKNVHTLVAAFESADLRDTCLVIVGPISESGYARQIARQIRESPRVADIRFEQGVYGDELKAIWDALDLFVLPSENENFGNAAGEAVAAGVPVLITETCGIAPLVHQRAGLAVPLGVDPLAEGLRTMLNPDIRRQLTARREEVKRDLSWEGPIRQTEELYRRIVAEGATRPG
jgi:glycosyltransferase involved in cell wall biosynthesis